MKAQKRYVLVFSILSLLLSSPTIACERPSPENELSDVAAQSRLTHLTDELGSGKITRTYDVLCELAIVSRQTGELQSAENLFLETAEASPDTPKRLRSKLEAADIARDRGDYVKTTQILIEAQSDALELNDTATNIDVSNRLASAYQFAGDYEAAIELASANVEGIKTQIASDPNSRNRLNLANQLNSLSIYYRENSQIPEAILALNESVEVLETLEPSERGSTDILNLVLLARLEDDQGNHRVAAEYIKRASVDLTRLRQGYPRLYPLFSGAENAGKLRDPALHDNYVSRMKAEYALHPEKTDLSTLYVNVYALEGHILAGRTEEALSAFAPVLELHESFYSKSRAEELAKLEADYQKIERESEIALLSSKADLDAVRLRNQRLILWLTILTALIALGGIYILLWRRNIKGKMDAKVQERTRIARELHDTIIQDFTGTTLKMQRALNHISLNPKKAEGVLATALEETDAALEAARTAILDQREPTEQTLSQLLEFLVSKHSAYAAPVIRLEIDPSAKEQGDSGKVLTEVSSMVEELLRNAISHADAENISVTLLLSGEHRLLTIEDDGAGFDIDAKTPGHFGIIGIRERAQNIGVKFRVNSDGQSGTQAVLKIPLSS